MVEPQEPHSPRDARVALITAPDRDAALRLARGLVEARLAACVNVIGGLTSVYRWEGEVQQDDEVLLVVKTRAQRVEQLERQVRELHPYDVPEIVLLVPDHVETSYLAWLLAESGDPAGPRA